ncbi:Helix-turn-helix domain-containing protein [Asanoa hainanensis]|uniref:Helix-turn-helix domain-containing protein n=1 Tax=Asanoa hainanensis TaxID=560556 RepID=A0A239PB40_9ACTN|nr:helix-turn-helix transcriptional regulator [Asanoa hainanensis]SNT64165.1 Helix-turn-helix domain-containing protein [Asanoa hainanensis]
MVTNLGAPDDNASALGARLARLRRAQNLTGRQLGRIVGLSQPKISRLENGVGPADTADVERIARALGAPDDIVAELVELAELSHERMTDWRPLGPSLAHRQRSAGAIEADVRVLRVFQPLVIPGLLQSSDYARAVLAPFQHLIFSTGEAAARVAVPEAVSARIARQEILVDPARTFHFLMLEHVLTDSVCGPEFMSAQIERLREIAKQENVTVGVIPDGTRILPPPLNGFELADADLVTVDLLNTALTSRGRTDVAVYGQIFDEYAELATTDIDAILDHHMDVHSRALQARQRH